MRYEPFYSAAVTIRPCHPNPPGTPDRLFAARAPLDAGAAPKEDVMVRREFQTVGGVKNGGRREKLKLRILLAEFHQARFRPKALGTVFLRNESAVPAVPWGYKSHIGIFPDCSDAKAGKWDEGIVLGG